MKSQGIKSGDRGGHEIEPALATTISGPAYSTSHFLWNNIRKLEKYLNLEVLKVLLNFDSQDRSTNKQIKSKNLQDF